MRTPDALTWKIHREVVLLAGWGRAILLQFAHPLVAQGVAEHSGFLRDSYGRLGRLHRTLRAMLTLTFGTPEEACRVAEGIKRLHDRVHGRLDAPAGPFGEGTAYTAHDPALLHWVHATLLDSFLLVYERFVGPLSPAERDRYCLESSGLEVLFGLPAGWLPRSTAALQAYMDGMVASGAIVVTETARRLAREIVWPSRPLVLRPLMPLVRLPTVGLLPPSIREAYGLPGSPRAEWALRCEAVLVRALLPLVPPVLRHWPASRRGAARETVASR